MSKQDIINEIKSAKLPVIISGAGVIGKTLLEICEKERITVECFCDNSEKVAQSNFCGLEVIHTPTLGGRYKDATIIVSVASIKDAVDLLQELGFHKWYAGGLLLKDMDISQSEALIDYAKFAGDNCIVCHEGYLNSEKLFIRSIDIIITERCSLRCKDCSNLMQYYEKPRNCDTGMLLKSLDAFCAVVDEVMDFRIIGGEAFVNPEWPVIVKRLTIESKARRVMIYTNATIVPKQEQIECLQNSKVIVIATDYGPLSRNLAPLRAVLDANRIAYHVLKMTEWLDCAAITQHNRGEAGNREIFKMCCAKNIATLSDGKMFRCPYSANAARLGAVPNFRSDYIDFLERPMEEAVIRELRRRVSDYLLHTAYLETCDFCNGRPLSGVEVTPAVQAQKPLAYRKYGM